MRRYHLYSKLQQLLAKSITVIGAVAHQSFRLLAGQTLNESLSHKSDLMRRSRLRVDGDRKTRSVCHCYELRAFAPLSLTNSESLFLATTKVPSMKHSDRSISPPSRRSSATASKTRFKTPTLTHCWNFLWQVWYGGNRSGKSCQQAPLRSIQSTPFKTSRVSRQGLPQLSSRRGGSGMRWAIIAQWSSVSSSPLLLAMSQASLAWYLWDCFYNLSCII